MEININEYTMDELILTALKSEIDSQEIYNRLAEKTKNIMLKDRFEFLAGEEVKHRDYLEDLYNGKFPDRKLTIPEESPVPLPEITLEGDPSLPEVIKQAMEAEKAAAEFYRGMADSFEGKDLQAVKKTLHYFAQMEEGHYDLLKTEREKAEEFETRDETWDMIHIGP